MRSYNRFLRAAPCTLVCATLAFPFQVALAQGNIGSNNLTYSIDSESTYNVQGTSGPNATGPAVSGTLTGGVSIKGVTGNGGTTYLNCYDNFDGNIFSRSVTMDTQVTFTWTPSRGHTHQTYCSANYTGNYANGTVQTGTVTFNT